MRLMAPRRRCVVVVMMVSMCCPDRLFLSAHDHDRQFSTAECPLVARFADTDSIIERFERQPCNFQDLATLHVRSKVNNDIRNQDTGTD
jgi:hypothetical protein